jgi:hypothetical protein
MLKRKKGTRGLIVGTRYRTPLAPGDYRNDDDIPIYNSEGKIIIKQRSKVRGIVSYKTHSVYTVTPEVITTELVLQLVYNSLLHHGTGLDYYVGTELDVVNNINKKLKSDPLNKATIEFQSESMKDDFIKNHGSKIFDNERVEIIVNPNITKDKFRYTIHTAEH